MKFTIKKNIFARELNYVARGISTRPQMPTLAGIKVDVKDTYILLTATNSEISVQSRLSDTNYFDIEEQGTAVLPGKLLTDIVRKSDAEDLIFTSFEETIVKIIAGRSIFTMNTLDKELFPYIPFTESTNYINLDALNVKQIIKKTIFATSFDEGKTVLTGVSFTSSGQKIEAVSTDSYRIAKKYIITQGKNPEAEAIIPAKSLDELNKILEEGDEIVQIFFLKTKILFKYRNILFLTRLIEGKFPDLTRMIPNEYAINIKFNKLSLLSAIDRAALFITTDLNIVKMEISGGKVHICSIGNEIGGTIEEVTPLEISNNGNFQLTFSAKYFLEALRAFDSSDVTMHITSEVKPFIITGDYDVNHLQLILPTRTL